MRVKNSFFKGMAVAALPSLLLWGLIIYAIHLWASLPVVTYSHSTGECVSVSDIDGLFSCENLPEKYESVWTQ